MSGIMVKTILLAAFATSLAVLPARGQDSETLFNQKCANCHAKDGSGHTAAAAKMAMPDLRAKRIKDMSDADLTDSIANGSKHFAYPHAFAHVGMTNDQITGLVKYIRVLQALKKPTDKP